MNAERKLCLAVLIMMQLELAGKRMSMFRAPSSVVVCYSLLAVWLAEPRLGVSVVLGRHMTPEVIF
jgi:hypothetical protein